MTTITTMTTLETDDMTGQILSEEGVERARAALAQTLGVDAGALRVADRRWLELLGEGVLGSVHVGHWSARARLVTGDLGLPTATGDAGLSGDLLSLGVKRLLPRTLFTELQTAAGAVRACLYHRAFACHWGYFIPVTAYQDWKDEFARRQARFFGLRDRLVAEYATWRADLAAEYTPVARAALARWQALNPGVWVDAEPYVEGFVARVLDLIPSREALGASFTCTVDLAFIPLPAYLDAAAGARPLAGADPRRIMQGDVLREAQARKQELIDGFLRDVVVQLRSLVYDATTDVLEAVQKNKALVGSSARQLRNLVSRIESLNFYGDEELEQGMARISALLAPAPEDRALGEITSRLQNLATLTRATLLDLGAVPRRARDLGIADLPTPELIRRARRGLGLDQAPDAVPLALPAPAAPRQLRLDALSL